MKTPFGTIYLSASDRGITRVGFEAPPEKLSKTLSEPRAAAKILREGLSQLTEYFKGTRQVFDLPMDADGTDFQKRVWKELTRIPFGKTISYGELARRVKNPKASRAVGSANGKNPIGIVVPCHRVISSDGSIGGYAGGVPLKKHLLALESGNSSID
jgi:methylated-DNA-[protein]-cysteine S-methyltransferase